MKNLLNIDEMIKDLYLGEYGDNILSYDGSEYVGDAITYIADNNVDIYYSDLAEYLKHNSGYVEQAIQEFGWEGCGSDIWQAIRMGQYLEIEEDLYENLDNILKYYTLKYIQEKHYEEMVTDNFDELFEKEDFDNNNTLSDLEEWADEFIEDMNEEDEDEETEE